MISDDLFILIAFLSGFCLFLLAIYALVCALCAVSGDAECKNSRLELAMREREALEKALGRG